MSSTHLVKSEEIQNKIYTIRDVQVMLDEDLSVLYDVETRRINEQVKRNIDRFPEKFMFQLTTDEYDSLRSQIVSLKNEKSLRSQNAILENARGRHRKYLPYAFTEQGVAMLSVVLRSETAVKVSIRIMEAFVAMRRFMLTNAQVFQRLDTLEVKQIETDKKIDKILNAIEMKDITPKQGIFFDGQIFDAYKFVAGLVRKANKSILLIDNYVDETVLDLFSKKKKDVSLAIFTGRITKALQLDAKKFNAQHPSLEIMKFSKAHDRFLIIDDKDVYHFGASLKDLGKKWFAFSMMDKAAFSLMENLKKVIADEKMSGL
jgi:hypothetical protein